MKKYFRFFTIILTMVITISIPITSYAKRIYIVDLGEHPILNLFIASLISAAIWFVAHILEDMDIPIISTLSDVIASLARMVCVGSLLSIPLNLILNLLFYLCSL